MKSYAPFFVTRCFRPSTDPFFKGGGVAGRNNLYVSLGEFGLAAELIEHPMTIQEKPIAMNFESIMAFAGADLEKISSLDAEIEFVFNGEKHIINEVTFVHIPAYMEYGPVIVKRVGKPFNLTRGFFTAAYHEPGQKIARLRFNPKGGGPGVPGGPGGPGGPGFGGPGGGPPR